MCADDSVVLEEALDKHNECLEGPTLPHNAASFFWATTQLGEKINSQSYHGLLQDQVRVDIQPKPPVTAGQRPRVPK